MSNPYKFGTDPRLKPMTRDSVEETMTDMLVLKHGIRTDYKPMAPRPMPAELSVARQPLAGISSEPQGPGRR